MEAKELKLKALHLLENSYQASADKLAEIDSRLDSYYVQIINESGMRPGEEDLHNINEVLGAMRLLRQMQMYEVNVKKVQQVIRLREGEWEQDHRGMWKWKKNGLLLPGTRGATHYRWQPFQVFVLTAMYGPQAWVSTGVHIGERELLDTERENPETGYIEDLRRLCTDFTFYAPRKTDKTGLSAYNNFLFFFLEDSDSEIYCCANSQTQSKLLYDRTQQLIRQMDPQERMIRFTASETNWKPGQFRQAQLWALSAGGKTKDGLFAQLCCADEFGSASYVGDKSDMGALVNVVLSSMGPRREPMLFTSTTAGNIKQGPFIDKLSGIKAELLKEIDYAEGTSTPTLEMDRWMCICLEPDEWEMDEEVLFSSKSVRRKVNPMLGTIVQHSFYEQAIADSRLDPLKKTETITKLFNVYQSNSQRDWLTPEQIRPLQTDFRIDDCTADNGWIVFCGLDFSKGDDLNGVSYLAYNLNSGQFFADMDSYMSERAVLDNPVRELLLKWSNDGWLHVVPGQTFDPSWPVNRIKELTDAGVNFIHFGYDPYNAKIVINSLGAWLFDYGLDPKDYIFPVRQNFSTYNPAVAEFDYMVKRSTDDGRPDPMIHFSRNPMWPWQFGNAILLESSDGMGNVKPWKRDAGASCKVDNVQMLLSALILYDAAESRINK